MSSSGLSSLSSAESIETDDEILSSTVRTGNLDRYFKSAKASASPPPKRKRTPSPPHEYVLADNADIAVRFARPILCACVLSSGLTDC